MPTERFNKLPEEKKKAIRDAAMEECIRVPFEKVSINKIIQNAGISRGSFYTYFEDKRDLVRYIFSDTADKLKFFWTKSVVTHGGNLWIASEELLDQAIIFAQKGKMFQMMQSMTVDMHSAAIFHFTVFPSISPSYTYPYLIMTGGCAQAESQNKSIIILIDQV